MDRNDQLFKDIFDKNSKKIFHLCYGYTGDKDSANDLLQETFLKVWQNLDKFRNKSLISTWIYRIAANTCLTHLRKKNEQFVDADEERLAMIPDDERNKEQEVQLLYKCISKLAETDRLIITLVLEDKPYEEIASILGISIESCRTLIYRCLKELRKKL